MTIVGRGAATQVAEVVIEVGVEAAVECASATSR